MGWDQLRRTMATTLVALLVLGCDGSPAGTALIAPASPAAPKQPTTSTLAPPAASDGAASSAARPPYTEERWEAEAESVIASFAEDLAAQYDGIDRPALDRWFTPEGLASARERDWRLRAALDDQLVIDAEVLLRYGTTSRTALDADPPLVEIDVAFVVPPTSWLVDGGGTVLERFDHPRYFGATYALRYDADADRWRVTAVAPPADGVWLGPDQPRAPVRCPGLDPEADGGHPVATTVWCFGGDAGSRAYSSQVLGFEHVPCGATDVTVLTVGWPIGEPIDPVAPHTFVRDPDGDFDRTWQLDEPWEADAALPEDAFSTGLTDGEYEIWVSPSAGDAAIWAAVDDRFERWPRAGEWGVTDCN